MAIKFKDVLQPKKFEIDFHLRHTCKLDSPQEKFDYECYIDPSDNFIEDYSKYDIADRDELHIDGINVCQQIYKEFEEQNSVQYFDDNLKQIIEDAIDSCLGD